MPRGDGTGPMGMGPMTGRGAGICAGYNTPGYANSVGFGRGRGFRRMYYATGLPRWARYEDRATNQAYTSEYDDKELLKRQAKMLEDELYDLKKRIASFDKSTDE